MRRTHKSAEFGWAALRVPIPPFTIYVMNLSFIVSVIRHVSTFKCNSRLRRFRTFVPWCRLSTEGADLVDSSVKDNVIASSQIVCLLSEAQRRCTYNCRSFLYILTFAFNGSYWLNKTCYSSGFPLNAE